VCLLFSLYFAWFTPDGVPCSMRLLPRRSAALALPSHPRTFFIDVPKGHSMLAGLAPAFLALPCHSQTFILNRLLNHRSSVLVGPAPAFLACPSHPQSFSVYNKTSFYLSSLMLGDDQRHTRADIAAAHSCYDRFCLGVITRKICAVTPLIIKQFQ